MIDIVATGLNKEYYNNQVRDLRDENMAEVLAMEGYEEAEAEASSILEAMEKEELRNMILKNKRRIDGRGPEDIREIWTETGYFPRAHGSAIFTRGETQALVSDRKSTRLNSSH